MSNLNKWTRNSCLRLFWTLALSSPGSCALTTAAAPPNVLLIVTDDQGYGDLSAYAHHAPDVLTPHMDRIAAGGVLFSRPSVPAGRLPPRADPCFGCFRTVGPSSKGIGN